MPKSIYVGNLEWNTTEQELYELFEPHGIVRNAQIIKDHVSNRSKGFGFVEMDNDDDADSAIQDLQNVELRGRTLKINAARERKGRTFTRPSCTKTRTFS